MPNCAALRNADDENTADETDADCGALEGRRPMSVRRVLCVAAAAVLVSVLCRSLWAVEPQTLGDADFVKLHAMLKPQADESRWMEIVWYPSVWEARQKAAKEGKPILLMAGSGGAPAAGC